MAALRAGQPVGPPGAAGVARGVGDALLVRVVEGRLFVLDVDVAGLGAAARGVPGFDEARVDGAEEVRAGRLAPAVAAVRGESPVVRSGVGPDAGELAAGGMRAAAPGWSTSSRSTVPGADEETARVPPRDAATSPAEGVQLRLTADAARPTTRVFAPTPAPLR